MIIEVLFIIKRFKCSGFFWWYIGWLFCGCIFNKWWIVDVLIFIFFFIVSGKFSLFKFVIIDFFKWVVVFFVGVINVIFSKFLFFIFCFNCNVVNKWVIVFVFFVFGLLEIM